MSFQQPFNPGAPPIGPGAIQCDYCHEEIQPGHPAAELFAGVVGRSPKSGYAMVVEGTSPIDPIVLHFECIELYARHEIFAEAEDMMFCSSCSARIEGDSD
jgi:hypothetical protein